MGKIEEHIGERWGRLVIIGTVWNEKRGKTYMVCRCDCGNEVENEYHKLKIGKVQSCGCLLRETTEKRVEEGRIHEEERRKKAEQYFLNQRAIQYIKRFKEEYRKRNTEAKQQAYHDLIHQNRKLYYIWQNMLQRCTRPTHHKYHNYGGRGITVCAEWQSFEGFYKWATTNGYSDKLSIDRIDDNGNYEPSNCRWTDMMTQQNNKRTNVWLERNGEIHTLAEWSRLLRMDCKWLGKTWQKKGFNRVSYEDVNR